MRSKKPAGKGNTCVRDRSRKGSQRLVRRWRRGKRNQSPPTPSVRRKPEETLIFVGTVKTEF